MSSDLMRRPHQSLTLDDARKVNPRETARLIWRMRRHVKAMGRDDADKRMLLEALGIVR